ncbi:MULTISPECIES: DUF1353 domain-containing protein [unclassified Gordonia (in: high G+C Gram-positive bacteria)]|uniref:DUF1353 domain-containing protein n=1 Tax=unclassified Gordonia (in: high G+C Gram-positive bacteria) TaxID=2657482 RepID=UPI001331BC59|nr:MULTISPECIES: DUF1353 domain-containing protein [unclassified Gordonia (in: high G+C Gram-positive bacteria)]KAF0967964.1 hypothetical protein BPODLACK_03423 [Gordonia sp. YY1]MCR8900074.1 DUF1353 domain-containing protein [Gordonia sp. GONU]
MGEVTSVEAETDVRWVPWRVAPHSGFEVDDPTGKGSVRVVQVDDRQFVVLNTFRYSDPDVEKDLSTRLVRSGMSDARARAAVDDARTFVPREDNPTDLASVPRFMRWFEDSYGRHTLAAMIHDELISDAVNSGALQSDTLSDRFFREMMRTSGVPWLKRWLMWSAVALRTRWVAGGYRRWSIVLWLLLSVVGITATVGSAGALLFDWPWPVSSPAWSLVVALLMIFVAAPLWGRQWAASLIAAVGALWLVPAAAMTSLAWVVYSALERIARAVGLR